MNKLPKGRILKFIDPVLAGTKRQVAVLAVYADKFEDWAAFEKCYPRFTR